MTIFNLHAGPVQESNTNCNPTYNAEGRSQVEERQRSTYLMGGTSRAGIIKLLSVQSDAKGTLNTRTKNLSVS